MNNQNTLPPLPSEYREYIHQVVDLDKEFEESTDIGKARLLVYIVVVQQKDIYIDQPFIDYLNTSVDSAVGLTCFQQLAWQYRLDLQQVFPLDQQLAVEKYQIWFEQRSKLEFGKIKSKIDTTDELSNMLPKLTVELKLYWVTTTELRDNFDIDNDYGRAYVVIFWLMNMREDLNLDELYIDYFFSNHHDFNFSNHSFSLSNLHVMFWLVRKDLQQAFDIYSSQGEIERYLEWFLSNAEEGIAKIHPVKTLPLPGVNLIGMPRAELGIGEDVRMMAASFKQLDIDFSIYEFPRQTASSLTNTSVDECISEELNHTISIFCLPALEAMSAWINIDQHDFNEGYNIAYMPWELPVWPKDWLVALELFDEFWCSTEFVASSIKEITAKPVYVMPMAVELGATSSAKSAEFSVDSDVFSFLFCFDSLSFPDRKNPLCTIDAFCKAFPKGNENVELVLKVMNTAYLKPDFYREFIDMLNRDKRIKLVEGVLTKSDLNQLYGSCDAYVSLHRSEGFGRTIAEAMLHGLPVITSDFSGNKDFCTNETSFLVGGSFVEVKPGQYHFSDGDQYWFDPDVMSAAYALRYCYDNKLERLSKANAGHEYISNNYSTKAVAEKYRERLERVSKYAQSLAENSQMRRYISQVVATNLASEEFQPQNKVAVSLSEEAPKIVAFYLPQFHEIEENNQWWGRGFTEWTNVTKASPEYVGHYQPRLPADLGFYNLSDVDVIRKQVALAKHSGIHAFCIYYYWFNGRRLLSKPLDLLLENTDIDMPFCICWANENWTRRWDGMEHEVLLEQTYDDASDEQFVDDLLPIILDKRYLKMNGLPVIKIYRPGVVPDIEGKVEKWRELFREKGVGEVFFLMMQTFNEYEPGPYGLDGGVEFAPHNLTVDLETINDEVDLINPNYDGLVLDYSKVLERARDNSFIEKSYTWIRGCSPSWDNTARRPGKSTIFANTSVGLFEEWLEDCCKYALKNKVGSDSFVYINAWNEWAEGAYLEPDRKYGYAYLNAVSNVLSRY
jgi:glycosyltransferase involved in cell wall biosynthesis